MVAAYYSLLLISFLLTLVLSIPDMAAALLMVTLGLAAPLMFAAVLFSYALCLLPAVYYWNRSGAARAGGLALSIFTLAIFAYAPGAIGRRQAGEYAAAQQQGDHAPLAPVNASSLEIRRANDDYDDAFESGEACGPECRAAAVYNDLKWVRVIMEGRERKGAVETTTFYSVEHGEKCAALEEAKSDAVCVVVAADNREQAGLMIDLRPVEITRSVASPNSFMVVRNVKRAVARQAGKSAELLRQTDIRFEVAITPTLLAPHFQGINSRGIAVQRHEWRVNKVTLKDTLTSLGLRLTPRDGEAAIDDKPKNWREGVNETLTREMLAVLDLPQTQAFNDQQGAIVSKWVMHARQTRDWSPKMIALLRRILRDGRLETPTFFDQIFERNPAVTTALMPDVLALLGTEAAGPRFSVPKHAAHTFARLDSSLLKPHATQIADLMNANPETRILLLPAAGRLGVDPSPWLLPFEPAAKDYWSKLRGACYSEKEWAGKLVGPLKQLLEAPRQNRDQRNAIYAALVNLGERDYVTQRLQASTEPDDRRILKRIDSLLTRRQFGPDAICTLR